MKGVIGLAIVLCLGYFGVVMFVTGAATQEPPRLMPLAFGAPMGSKMQFQIGVAPVIPMADPPELNNRGVPLWDEWIAGHFQLRDAAGKDIRLNKMGTSAMMLDRKAGAPEFVIFADLEKGAEYTVEFVPVVAEKKRYRYTFTVPAEPKEVGRRNFEFVQES